jgi:long-subunit fatty acid transport protein
VQNPYEQNFKAGEKEVMIIGTVPHYTIEGDINYFTAGIGYRFTPQFYIDAAFVYRTQTDDLYAFPSIWDKNGNYIVESTPAKLTNNTYKGLVTVGYKF